MSLPSISVINFFTDLTDQEVQKAIRAVNRQVVEDFAPIWGSAYILRLHAANFDPADSASLAEEAVRGEAVIYLVDEATVSGALGFHDLNASEMSVGFVFFDANEWTVTLSHETLELIIDPTTNILVPGPDPRDPTNLALHAYEVCDAVERTSYQIDHTFVSNFLTPSYFAEGDALGTRNDFLGVGVPSFGVTRNSHIAFFDLSIADWVTVLGEMKPTMAQFAKRAVQYDRARPDRSDEKLEGILDSYHSNPHPKCTQLKRKGLRDLKGITRLSRYKASAERMMPFLKEGGRKGTRS